jgi:hypothetical protein
VSGHASRLDRLPFPIITEKEIFDAITKPTEGVERVVTASDGNDWEVKVLRQEAVCDEDVAKYILSMFGDNLAQIDKCLGEVVEEGGVKKVAERMGMDEVKGKFLGSDTKKS